ncbi:MAG: fibronectin type III domain-containing protein [candidate division WOR-3 bacterium]
MKSDFYLFCLLSAVAGVVLFIGCGVIGGPPGNLQVAAATDSTVQLVWTTPAAGVPDSFLIYFCPVNESVFTIIGDTSANTFVHNPQGRTGRYLVSAVFAGKEYKSDTVTTIPVHTEAQIISELDGTGNAGYGWDIDSGFARSYSMRDTANAPKVAFYITDFTTGSSLPYRIASPTMGPSDPSGVVPTGSWRRSGFTDPLLDENAPLPKIDSTRYFNYSTIPHTSLPAYFGVYTTADDHYALIKVIRVNGANATVEIESWFQVIPGLRLIEH